VKQPAKKGLQYRKLEANLVTRREGSGSGSEKSRARNSLKKSSAKPFENEQHLLG
jgi:hypothetical protein